MKALATFFASLRPAACWQIATAPHCFCNFFLDPVIRPAKIHVLGNQFQSEAACNRRPHLFAVMSNGDCDVKRPISAEGQSELQAKTWEFLKARRLVGKDKKVANNVAGGQKRPVIVYDQGKVAEKRALKMKVLAGEELAAEERQRLEELKALNKAKKEADLEAQGPILKKTAMAFRPCNETGVIDTINEKFPTSSSGTDWRVTRGEGRSEFFRSTLEDIACNLLRVKARTGEGTKTSLVHLSLDLSNELPPGNGTVDATNFSGVELEIFCPQAASYALLLKTPDCFASASFYRAPFETAALEFTTLRLPWSEFVGEGPGAEAVPLDVTRLRRLSLELGRNRDAQEVAVAGVKLY